MNEIIKAQLEKFDKKADAIGDGMTLGKYEKIRWRKFLEQSMRIAAQSVIDDIPANTKHTECRDGFCEPCDYCGMAFYAVGIKQKLTSKWLEKGKV